jgi:hypothetical protein
MVPPLLSHIDQRISELKQRLDVGPSEPAQPPPPQQQPQPQLAAWTPERPPPVLPVAPPEIVVPLTVRALEAHAAGAPLPTPSTPGAADAGSAVLCMIHKLASVTRELVDGLRLRLGGMRDASRQVLGSGLRELGEADHLADLAAQVGGGGQPGPLNSLLTDAVTRILSTAREALALYQRSRHGARAAAADLTRAHQRVLQRLDGVPCANDLRDRANYIYQVKRGTIQPRMHSGFVKETADLMDAVQRTTADLCSRAPHYTLGGSADLAQQYRLAVRTLADTIRSVDKL